MKTQSYSVQLSVRVSSTRPWESVFVVGDVSALGAWEPWNAVALVRDSEHSNLWSISVELNEKTVRYRYFVAYFLDAVRECSMKEMIISRWESFLHPRSVLVHVEARDGVRKAQSPDTFGCYGGRELISYGWLMAPHHNEIFIRVHGTALKFFKKRHMDCLYRIKVTPFDLRRRESNADEDVEDSLDGLSSSHLPSFSPAELAVLSREESSFLDQQPMGELFRNGMDYFVFRTLSIAVEFLFYLESENTSVFLAIMMPSSMSDTFGKTTIPILSQSQQPVGQFQVDYLFVRGSVPTSSQRSMEASYSRHWKRRSTLEVGHRGAGNSYTKLAAVRENTLSSLNYAARNGADFVEFDVHLTKDKVPIVYHDFHVLVSVTRRPGSSLSVSSQRSLPDESDYHEMAVKDLRLRQLQLLHLTQHQRLSEDGQEPRNETSVKRWEVTGTADEGPEHRPFPTLVEALRGVDADVGFNIEVKYPMMQKNELHECEHYFERNEFVDLILRDVFEYGGNRRILFSSFDPDACSMIALKQNRYPVLFLCVGTTTRYVPFLDIRCGTSQMAVNFAYSAQLLGVNFHAEDLLRDASPMKRAKALGLISFVWGDDLERTENMDYFKKELGVNGLIYDRIGELDARKNVFTVEREAKDALFNSNSRSCSPARRNSFESSLPFSRSSNGTSLLPF